MITQTLVLVLFFFWGGVFFCLSLFGVLVVLVWFVFFIPKKHVSVLSLKPATKSQREENSLWGYRGSLY